MTSRRVLLVTTALAAVACGDAHDPAPGGEPPSLAAGVETSVAKTAAVPVTRLVSGAVIGRSTIAVEARVSGRVHDLRAVGDVVAAGDLLARIDAPERLAEVRRAEAQHATASEALREAESSLVDAEAQAELAAQTAARFRDLLGRRAVTQQEYDEVIARERRAIAGRDAARARIARATAEVAATRAAADAARAYESYTRVGAPFAGRVVEHHVDGGAIVRPGMSLLLLEESGAHRLEIQLGESLSGRIALGDAVAVELPGRPDRFEGRVVEITPQVQTATRTFRVEIELTAEPGSLRPGLFARAHIPIGEEQRLLVPVTAVSSRGQLDRVRVVEDGRIRMRLVTLGAPHGETIEIRSGLSAGETIVRRWSDADRPSEAGSP